MIKTVTDVGVFLSKCQLDLTLKQYEKKYQIVKVIYIRTIQDLFQKRHRKGWQYSSLGYKSKQKNRKLVKKTMWHQ